MNGLQPLVQRCVAVLENRANADGKLLAAVAALLQAVTLDAFGVLLAGLGANALQGIDPIHAAAVGANGAFRPQYCLQLSEGCSFIVKVFGADNRHDLAHEFRISQI